MTMHTLGATRRPEIPMNGGFTGSVRVALIAALALLATGAPLMAQAGPDSTRTGASRLPPVRSSWLSDGIALRVGDIVTVFVDEVTLASADVSVFERQDRGREVRLGLPSNNFSLETTNNVGEQERGESARRERFQAEMSARVVEVVGDLARLEGTRRMGIDEHEQVVSIRGWVRGRDVSTRNTVESWRLADAEIVYESNGELGKTGGFWSTILNLILP